MGRSVSTPSDARHVLYLDWTPDLDELNEERVADGEEPIEWDDAWFWQEEWDYVIYDLREHVLKDLFPSVEDADRWHDQEDHVIAENELVEFGISEYCGLASIWVRIRSDRWDYPGDYNLDGLAAHWIDQAWPKVEDRYPNRMYQVGRFSNGEGVYRKAG